MADAVDILAPGTVFQDRYEVLEEIGTGSFGRVCRARQVPSGQIVAVKMLRPSSDGIDRDDEVGRARFRREMELSARLTHPNIVALVDSGEVPDGRLFAVFKFVEGMTLRELLDREGQLETPEALRLMAQVLDALSCAHALGVVHRDLKPENIMITETGARRNALVLDFGLGGFSSLEVFTQAQRLTATRQMMGTPSYSAPEQLRGEHPTPASDLYSWGLVLLECLTGEPAIQGTSAYEVLTEQLSRDPVPIPAWLYQERIGQILSRVVAKNVDEREASAAEALAMLEEVSARGGRGTRVPPVRRAGGERRQLTVLAMRPVVTRTDGGEVDLDDLEEILPPHHERIAAVVQQQGGIVLGPDVAIFGYPVAQETDARRAIRTALRIAALCTEVCATLEAERGRSLAVCMGIHSDVVSVRGIPESAGGETLEIIGRARDLASRLEARAKPGEILASESMVSMWRGEVRHETVSQLDDPGSSRPIAVVRVLGLEDTESAESALAAPAAPLVERALELGQLEALWQRAKAGVPGALLLVGEAGIGKSRLVLELRRRVTPDSWLEGRCALESEGSPLRPIADLLRAIGEPIEVVLERHGFDLQTAVPLVTSLLDLPRNDRFEPLRLAPDHARDLAIDHLVQLFARMADTRPIVLVIEDLQWADATTLQVLRRLTEVVANASGDPLPLVFISTARPQFTPPWNATDAAVVRLARLSPAGVGELVQHLLGNKRVAGPDLLAQVAARTDGIPLFVEELTHALGGGSGAGKADHMIPSTIRGLLTARLDALSPRARATVQLAATLGREFAFDLLRGASDHDEALLRRDVREVMNADLLHQRRSTSAEHYVFRHALLRDAAYESMPRSSRAALHRRIARTMESHFPEVVEQQPELVAQHLQAGPVPVEAVPFWQRAADRALRRAAYQESMRALERALALLAAEPASPEHTHQQIEALITLGTVQFSTQGYAAAEVEETFARAQALCIDNKIDASPKILSGIVGVHITRGNREATDALLPHFHRMATVPRDTIDTVTGWTALSIDAFWRGQHERARAYLDQARPAYRSPEFQAYAREYGYDGGIFSYAYTVWNEWMLGRAGTAEAAYQELLTLAENSFDPYSFPLALCYGMALAHWRQDAAETRARAEQLVARASEQKLYLWLAVGMCGLGGAAVLEGKAADGIGQVKQGLELSKTIGDMASYGVYLTYLAAAHEALGETDEGLAVADEGLALCATALGRFHEPELLRLRGLLLAGRGMPTEAEESLRAAIRTAQEHGALAWTLRSTNTLAGFLREAGRSSESDALVSETLAHVTGDVDVAELQAMREAASPAQAT